MQYRSCHSGRHYSGEQIIASNGRLWPQFDSGVSCGSSRDYNFLFQPPSIDQRLNYNKDLAREIMLKHEAMFKCQVYELHRLYGRQRELMDEIQMKKLSTNCFVSRMKCDISQKALQQIPYWLLSNPRDNEPQGGENFQKPSTFVPGTSIHVSSDYYNVENDFKQLEASADRRNNFRKRLLDLELPAELYMDTDEGEQLEEKKTSEIHPVLHDPSMDISNSSKKSNVVVPSDVTSINLNSSYRGMSYVFDLNEPVQVDEPTNPTSSMYSNMNSREIIHQDQDLSGSIRSKSSVLNEIVHGIMEENGSAGSSFTSGHEISFSGKVPISSTTTSSSLLPFAIDTNAIGSFNKPRNVPIVVQALPCFNTPAFIGTSRTSTGSAGIKEENLCPKLKAAGCPSLGSIITSHFSCDTENQSTDKHCCAARGFVDSDRTKAVVDLNLNVMPSSFLPETDGCQEKVEFTDGVVNLDLNVMPSSSLSETEVSQAKVGSMEGKDNLYKSDYDGKIVVNPKLLEPHGSSSQFSALTSITSPSSSYENEDIQKHEKTEIPARVMRFNFSPDLENCSKDDTYLGTESVKEISTCIDTPFTFRDENLSQVPSVPYEFGTGFEAPDSPDNQERSPPREESEENQTEQLEDSNKDPDRIAAETIISISISGGQQCLKTCMNWPFGASIDCLNWFAGIVSSAAGCVEDEFNDTLGDAPGGNCNQLTLNAFEHFEAKTCKSTGTEVEEICKTIDQKNIIPGNTALPSLRQRGRRARNAGDQKEIQAEVAPKDRTVATRNATKTVKGRRNVSKIEKRLSSKSFPNLAGRRVYSLSKQQQHTHESEQSLMQSWSFGWGKKNRRQKQKGAHNW